MRKNNLFDFIAENFCTNNAKFLGDESHKRTLLDHINVYLFDNDLRPKSVNWEVIDDNVVVYWVSQGSCRNYNGLLCELVRFFNYIVLHENRLFKVIVRISDREKRNSFTETFIVDSRYSSYICNMWSFMNDVKYTGNDLVLSSLVYRGDRIRH